MKQTTNNFQIVVNNTGRVFDARLTVGGKVYGKNEIIEAKITHEIIDGELNLGIMSAKRLDLRTVTIPKSELKGEMKLEIGLQVDGTFEYIEIGRFYANDIVDKEKTIVQTTAFDKIFAMDKAINLQNLNLDSTMQEIVTEICASNGLDEYILTTPQDKVFINNLLRGKTEREILGYVAEYLGGYFTIEGNALKLVTFGSQVPVLINGDNYYEVQSTDTLSVSAIEKYFDEETGWLVVEDETLEKGLVININADNFFVDEERLPLIFEEVRGKTFTNFEVSTIGNISAEVGDSIQIDTVKGEKISTFITEYEYVFNGTLNANYRCGVDTTSEVREAGSSEHVGGANKDELVVYPFDNLEDLTVSSEEVELLEMQFVSTTGKIAMLNGTIRLTMDKDGVFELRTYRDLLILENVTKRYYLARGEHTLAFNEYFELGSNKRNEITLKGVCEYYESDVRKQEAEVKTNVAKIRALSDFVTNVTESYIEPTETAIDTTVPKATIAFGGIRTVIFAQGLSSSKTIWDGNFDIVEKVPTFTLGAGQPLTLGNIIERVSTGVQVPMSNPITEIVPTFTLGAGQPLTLGNIREFLSLAEIIKTDEFALGKQMAYDAEYVRITANSFVLQNKFTSGESIEVAIDNGRMCELTIETDVFERVDGIGIEVIK